MADEEFARNPPLTYRLLADVVAVLHFGYVAFVVGGLVLIIIGGLRGWRWVRNPIFRGLHLAAIALVILEHLLHWECPLTALEYHLRALGGEQTSTDRTFVGNLMAWVMCMDEIAFDAPLQLAAHYSTAGLIVGSFLLVPPRLRRRTEGTPPIIPK